MPNATLEYKRTDTMYPKQRDFFNCKKQFAFCLGSNKCGKTDLLCIYLLETCMREGKIGRYYCWISPVTSQAIMAFDNCILHLRSAGLYNLCKINKSSSTIELPNGGIIRFVGADAPKNIWGHGYYIVCVDEASWVKPEAWNAILTTIYHTKGKIRCIGNPVSRFTWFYKAWLKAKLGEYEGGEAFHLNAYDAVEAGVLGKSFIEKEKKRLSKASFQKNILGQLPSEDETNPFGITAISNCSRDYNIEDLTEEDRVVLCYGIDLAKSFDWTVITGLNSKGVIVYFERFQNPWELTKGKIINIIGDTITLIDSSGVGDPILESLQRKSDYVEGYKYSNSSKCNLIEKLALVIQQGDITIPSSNEVLLTELEAFETQSTPKGAITYNAGQGHDDCVNSLALCVMKWDELTNNKQLDYDYFL